jgi:hypothetical protein
MLSVRIVEDGGPVMALRWHMSPTPCYDLDVLHHELAAAIGLDGPAGADAVREAMTSIRDRAAARGDAVLRRTLDIRRDLDDPRYTLRGPGDAWGQKSARVRA